MEALQLASSSIQAQPTASVNGKESISGRLTSTMAKNASSSNPSSAIQSRSIMPSVQDYSAASVLPAATAAAPASMSATPSAAVQPLAKSQAIMVHQSVRVTATFTDQDIQPDHLTSTISSTAEIEAMPGAYSDIPRYVQTLPGVSADSDQRNTYMVRGGNPNENLYVINGFEVPNINHLSTMASTAGFVSMIDTDAISGVVLHTGAWNSAFSNRLSSVLEMQTLGFGEDKPHHSIDVGLGGFGLISSRHLGNQGYAMISMRRSFLNLFTSDIGIDGVPIYQSLMATFMRPISSRDSISGFALGGMDSIAINPVLVDWEDPFACSDRARSNRYNVGLRWQHSYSARSIGSLSVIQSNEHGTDFEAYAMPARLSGGIEPALNSPVYSDNLSNRISALRYDLLSSVRGRFNVRFGGSYSANQIAYRVNQYSGYPNPYTVVDAPMDALKVQSTPTATEQGYYADLMAFPHHSLELSAGARYQRWGLNQSHVFSPHFGVAWNVKPRFSLFANASVSSQVPPYLYLLVEPQNIQLKPITAHQEQIGISDKIADLKLTMTIYRKNYHDYPVSSEYPTLSMADVIDTFGQPFLWFPMISKGTGRGLGAEFSLSTSSARRVYFHLSAAQSSMKYTALDDVWRTGNYEYPFNGAALGGWHIKRNSLLTARYTLHTGAAYTPYLVQESDRQYRPIYDLTQINAFRGSMYERLDMRFEHTFTLGHSQMKVYGGGDNVLNRANFYQWILCPQQFRLDSQPYQLKQMGFYPEGGVTWRF
jgi:outer membrane receptor protein involved in Fe transport